MKKVLVFGTFDVLHPGHLDFFRQAKELGDELHVVVARDRTVKEVKDLHSHHSEKERLENVQSSDLVDKAYLGNLDDKYKVIEEIGPDIIALGYDQSAFVDKLENELKNRGLNNVKIVRLKPHKPEEHKSSLIRDKMA